MLSSMFPLIFCPCPREREREKCYPPYFCACVSLCFVSLGRSPLLLCLLLCPAVILRCPSVFLYAVFLYTVCGRSPPFRCLVPVCCPLLSSVVLHFLCTRIPLYTTDKTEFMITGSRKRLQTQAEVSIQAHIEGQEIKRVDPLAWSN